MRALVLKTTASVLLTAKPKFMLVVEKHRRNNITYSLAQITLIKAHATLLSEQQMSLNHNALFTKDSQYDEKRGKQPHGK